MQQQSVLFVRNIGAIIVGLIAGSCVNMALSMVNVKYLYPMPEGVSFEDTERFSEYVASLPLAAFFVVFAAHYGQAIVGGYVAAKLGSCCTNNNYSYSSLLPQTIASLTMVGSIVNNLSMSVPTWTWIEIPFYPVVGWLVGRHVHGSSRAKPEPTASKSE